MNLNEFFLIILTSALVNNFVLVQFLGLSPLINASNKLESAVGMAGATIIAMTVASFCSFTLNHWILSPLGLESFRTFVFILVIVGAVQLIKISLERISPRLHNKLGSFFPLITLNSAVLGAALLTIQKSHSLFESTLYGFGSALGFSLVLILFSAMRERLALADVPAPFKGAAIELISLGFISLAFIGFTGLGN